MAVATYRKEDNHPVRWVDVTAKRKAYLCETLRRSHSDYLRSEGDWKARKLFEMRYADLLAQYFQEEKQKKEHFQQSAPGSTRGTAESNNDEHSQLDGMTLSSQGRQGIM